MRIDGRIARYGVGGFGQRVLFLHGWGLSGAAYTRPLEQLIGMGMRVYVPALPGVGGTARLPEAQRALPGYAHWVGQFADTIGLPRPVTVVGHSFGGGVAITTAHRLPDLAERLVLVNSIGGSAWTDGRGVVRALRDRPLWDWGLHLPADLLPGPATDSCPAGRFARRGAQRAAQPGRGVGGRPPRPHREPCPGTRRSRRTSTSDLRGVEQAGHDHPRIHVPVTAGRTGGSAHDHHAGRARLADGRPARLRRAHHQRRPPATSRRVRSAGRRRVPGCRGRRQRRLTPVPVGQAVVFAGEVFGPYNRAAQSSYGQWCSRGVIHPRTSLRKYSRHGRPECDLTYRPDRMGR
ncbi:putative hydrolase [Rhodococcus wratislaviensis IFP 2016]|nr:putative hydrolase [Rhodococcus wratislaviensis IFP 2016]